MRRFSAMLKGTEGIARAREIYQDRFQMGKELKAEGKTIVGYVCFYAPVEVMSALDMIPFKIFGSMKERSTKADRFLPRTFCPIIRSVLSLSLSGKYDFLDGVVMVHTCDAWERTSRIWESVASPPYVHYMDMPTKIDKMHQEALVEEIDDFRKTLESFAGKELQPQKLRKAIETHNQQRHLVRRLYGHTKSAPPLISGKEIMEIIGAVSCLPVEEGNELLRKVLIEVEERKRSPEKGLARILVWGSVLEAPVLIEMIENAEADVVIDDTCTGTRGYFTDINLNKNPLDALAYYCLVDLKCPRTFKEAPNNDVRKDYQADLEARFGYLKDFTREWKVDGVILQSVKYCDCHGFEVPQVKDYFDNLEIPSLYLEHDFTEQGLRALKTRVEAFLEMISGKLY
jgi:bzd-type benzoyl-CoA reductase N subunit